ncbi:MAG: pyrroloquinoline quinone biosynthesis protein PqqE [Candidatus Omnitrophica bacterium ADurb.Bin277]|nr:MAG: pyrroloquinoline quinone biosynthesis protein PqqE [Candidatus Omnitrophica bacterium ADurb.Bin277]
MDQTRDFPNKFSIQTTSMCNAACIFCPFREIKELFPPRVMEGKLYRKIIDECAAHKNIERMILYMNNDPLTDPFLIERIDYAKTKVPWSCVHILTNGSLLTPSLADQLVASRLDWIGISLHGIRHETIKEAMGIDAAKTIERVLSFLDRVKSNKNIKDYVMITFLGHDHLNPEEKDEAVKFWRKQGVERISFFEKPISRAGNVKTIPHVTHHQVKGCASIWANEMMHVTEDGKVILCCMDWRREVVLGDLNEKSIETIWNSSKYQDVRDQRDGKKGSPGSFLCKRCEAAVV